MELLDRIKYIIKLDNISASAFADKINVQRSSISHILSGRNKPSLDFIQKVLSAYPKVSADWLISGRKDVVSTEIVENDSNVEKTTATTLPSSLKEKTVEKIVVFYTDKTFEEYQK